MITGAESLLQTLVNGGVDVCFSNPGTSEMHFVAAVDRVPGMRTVLALFEGVATGAADGYARMTGRPACTLLHLGPGLGNGIANLHNARRAHSPLINIVGEHASWHLKHDAPLTSDIHALASNVSGWIRTCGSAADVPRDGADAIAAALAPPGQIATLIVPGDCMWNPGSAPLPRPVLLQPKPVPGAQIDVIAQLLMTQQNVAMYAGGPAWTERGLALLGRIAARTGVKLLGHRYSPRGRRGAGVHSIERLAYPIPQALKQLESVRHIVHVGTPPPVGFFGYPNLPSELWQPGTQFHTLATLQDDVLGALEALAEAVHAPHAVVELASLQRPTPPSGSVNTEKVWNAIAAYMPAEAIFADESVTSGREADAWLGGAPPHDWLTVTGGSIGQGLPLAVGAAVACPDRKVINTQAEGSAMYTLQSLWTMAREQLDVCTVLFNNRAYRILQGEMKGTGALDTMADGKTGPKANAMMSLDNPPLNFVSLAQGMGVPAVRADDMQSFNAAFARAMHTAGPQLIEVMV